MQNYMHHAYIIRKDSRPYAESLLMTFSQGMHGNGLEVHRDSAWIQQPATKHWMVHILIEVFFCECSDSDQRYPLVICYIAMKNEPFIDSIPIEMVIFYGYVR